MKQQYLSPSHFPSKAHGSAMRKLPTRTTQNFIRFLGVFLIVIISVARTAQAAGDPLGSTTHDGRVTFRLWAPYADSVAVRINGATPIPMRREPGHDDP